MNRIIKKSLWFGCVLMCITILLSCEKDILDQTPKDSLTEETVWTDPQGATQFINAIYGQMPSGFDRNYQGWGKGLYLLDGVSDDGDVCMPWTHSNEMQTGNFLPSGTPWGETWGDYYNLIRKTNVALENLGRLGDESLRNRLMGEAYFLRGFIYHELLRLYGMKATGVDPTGVPLINKSLTLQDDFQIPRSTYDEVVDFIVSDLDKAASMLPKKGQIEAGRATSGAAYALESRVLLYAERWSAAAEAANKVINKEYTLFADYRTLFLTKNNQEIIFAKKFQAPDKTHFWVNNGFDVINTQPSFKGGSDAGWGGNVPTQNFVDCYEMIDGKSQSTSPLYNASNPYVNLDPRFEATVVHNGSTFRGHVMELYAGGADITGKPEDTKTGYALRKFHEEQYPIYSKSCDQDWIFIRYAEVLLNYAEAKNEQSGPDQTVYDAINEIRDRVDMPFLPTGLTKDQMRIKIRNERRVELAFEEHRFFDIRRWKIAENLLNGPLYGVKMTKSGNTITYTRYAFETRSFPSKLYVLPIPQSEFDKNPAAKQINGW
ncbi:RagB/SusD family nutrient uptake outer membrane protein [Flavobacterium sufflavum]|uniref:RagB/SusD family nutrient uptake outer membrane protein n=1 Tax=Flavobacterium sufflavum TaxID=1921138 RepID=A0A3S2TZJ3_9FLAO|nr:RagB/SusD family nutrient uptake outer membrane protein [Flavobacterium sufflavum]RVT73092.1 RagB/SusD family nutrient uptake outer membrane protein [Flavobacterium sufflavum]